MHISTLFAFVEIYKRPMKIYEDVDLKPNNLV